MKKNMTIKNQCILDVIQDKATVANSNHSAVIEETLYNALFTGNQYAECVYTIGMKYTLMSICQTLGAGVNIKSDDTYFPLVKLALDILAIQNPFAEIDADFSDLAKGHLQANFSVIKSKLECDPSYHMGFDELEIVNSKYFCPYNYVSFILSYWEELKNCSYTYRLLYDVIALSNKTFWENLPPYIRLLAKDTVAFATADWGD